MTSTLTLGEVAELVGGELRGESSIEIRAVAPISAARSGDLTWVADPKYAKRLDDCQASAVLTPPDVENGQIPVVVCEKPELALAQVLQRLQPPLPHPPEGVDATASIGEQVQLAEGVSIGPRAVIQSEAKVGRGTIIHAGVFVGQNTVIGEDCLIWPNAVIRERCEIGDRVIIHPNATIGADGFGYNFDEGQFRKIPQIGTVRIGDDVEIGASACIDRAKCGVTTIGRGTKIDNLVQIAHNVKIGEHCCIIAHAGIAGSTELGDYVTLAGKVGVKDNIKIGSRVQAAACSCIAGHIADGEIVLGIPAIPKAEFFREHSALRRLPGMATKVRELLKRVAQLEATNHSKNS